MEQDSSDILCPACGNWFARQIIGRDVRCPSCGKLVERVATPSQSTPLSDSTDDDFAYEMSTAAEAIYVAPRPRARQRRFPRVPVIVASVIAIGVILAAVALNHPEATPPVAATAIPEPFSPITPIFAP